MQSMLPDGTAQDRLERLLWSVLEPVINADGFECVDLQLQRNRRARRLGVIVYRADGVDAASLESLAREIHFQLPLIGDAPGTGLADVTLEVSSPGVDRVLRAPREYAIFTSRAVRVLRAQATEWEAAVIVSSVGETVTLRFDHGEETVPIASIRRAQLTGAERGST
ncbi:MAG: hypothetical protein OXH96_11355 [Spirochaetaceae bacterium]|nr:hypothetical protein [Spirochaetaceae bacterium]